MLSVGSSKLELRVRVNDSVNDGKYTVVLDSSSGPWELVTTTLLDSANEEDAVIGEFSSVVSMLTADEAVRLGAPEDPAVDEADEDLGPWFP